MRLKLVARRCRYLPRLIGELWTVLGQQLAADLSRVVSRLTLLFKRYLLDFCWVDPLGTWHIDSARLAVSLQDIFSGTIFD